MKDTYTTVLCACLLHCTGRTDCVASWCGAGDRHSTAHCMHGLRAHTTVLCACLLHCTGRHAVPIRQCSRPVSCTTLDATQSLAQLLYVQYTEVWLLHITVVCLESPCGARWRETFYRRTRVTQ